MPQVCLLLVGASVLAPPLLFLVVAWNGIEQRLELAANEGRVRSRFAAPRTVPLLVVAGRTPAPISPGESAA